MSYKLFLDDLRVPTDIYPKTNNDEWLIVRNLTDFKNTILSKGVPDYISFDNDLGKNENGELEEGKDAAKWMVYEKWLDISNMNFIVHSANSSGVREFVLGLLNNWKKELKTQKEEMNKNQIRKEIREILTKSNVYTLNEEEIRMKYNIPIPEDIMKIKDLLKSKGYKLFIVGGAVRDALLGKTPKDYDLATNAVPDKVEEIMKAAGYKTLPTGKAFGVINVFTYQGEYEIATFREDQYKGDDLEGFKEYLKSLNNGSYENFLSNLTK